MEKLKTPEDFIPTVLERVKKEYLSRMYKIKDWKDPMDFIDQMARRTGRLLKHGDPDINAVSRMILNDWQRGKLPFFVAPPSLDGTAKKPAEAETKAAETVEPVPAPVEGDEEPVGQQEQPMEKEEEEDNGPPTKRKFEPVVIQDFSKIRVDLHYEGDDVQPLEAQPELENADDDASEEEPLEEEAAAAAAAAAEAEKDLDDSDWLDEEDESDQSDDDSDDDANRKEKKKEKALRLKTRTITKSGSFSVSSSKKQKRGEEDEDDEVTKNPRHKLTSRERRKIERDQKQKKVGAHFYEVVNVKNKSKKKGFLEMAKAFRGHCKK